jgi:hypothetical protein
MTRAMRRDDHFPFRIGDIVRETEGRHEAEVRAVHFNTVLLRWLDTGWRGEATIRDLVLVRSPQRDAEAGTIYQQI